MDTNNDGYLSVEVCARSKETHAVRQGQKKMRDREAGGQELAIAMQMASHTKERYSTHQKGINLTLFGLLSACSHVLVKSHFRKHDASASYWGSRCLSATLCT